MKPQYIIYIFSLLYRPDMFVDKSLYCDELTYGVSAFSLGKFCDQRINFIFDFYETLVYRLAMSVCLSRCQFWLKLLVEVIFQHWKGDTNLKLDNLAFNILHNFLS